MRRLIVTLSFFLPLLASAQSQESPGLEALKLAHAVAIENLGMPQKALDEKYLAQLEKLNDAAKKAGDFEQILFIKKETEALGRGATAGDVPAAFTEVARARKIYGDQSDILAAARNEKVKPIRLEYRRKLLALRKTLTKADKMDAAINVNNQIKALDARIASGAPVDFRHVAANTGSVAPGKLVIFGSFSDGTEATLPEQFADEVFTSIATGYDHWLAVKSDGTVVGRPDGRGTGDFRIREEISDAVSVTCGRHMHFAMHRDGTFTAISNSHHLPTIPEDLSVVKKISVGHSLQAVLLNDGTVKVFGYYFRERPFRRTELLSDVADISVGAYNLFFKKNDGTVVACEANGGDVRNRPDIPEGTNIVAMESGLVDGCLMLTDEGKLLRWNMTAPPEGLGKVVAITVGTSMAAAQKEDGTWVIWGRDEDYQHRMNAKLEELGPLKTLRLGRRFFIAIK